MKFKTLLFFSIIIILKNVQPVFSQNTTQADLNINLPRYVKELQQGLPPDEMKYTDPKQYEFLLKRRAMLTGMLQKAVQDKRLPETALDVLKTQLPAPNNFSNNQIASVNKTAGTNIHLTKDINQVTNSNPSNYQQTNIRSFAVLKKCIYYAADDGIHGTELWRSDGTEAGTYMVKDISEGVSSSLPTYIIAFKNKIFFNAYSPETGYEIYQSDGTENGTILLKETDSGSNSRYPEQLTVVGNKLYFVTYGLNYKSQLWKTNGTNDGTVLVAELYTINTTYNITQLTAVDDNLFFTAYSYYNGRELWKSNGTAAGTSIVKDINTSDNSDFNGPRNLTALNGRLYFSAGYYSRTLWVSDGTGKGTKEVNINSDISLQYSYYNYGTDQPFAIANNILFFAASRYDTGNELYKYDPSKSTGIKLVADIVPGSGNSYITTDDLRSMNGKIYFLVSDISGRNFDLWKSGGIAGNTKIIKSLSGYYNYNSFSAVDSNLYFSGYSPSAGYEPWISDGTTSGTKLLKDISSQGNSNPIYFTACNGYVFFSAYKAGSGRELWLTKGKAENTVQVKDINTTTTESAVTYYYTCDSLNSEYLVFQATNQETGTELWKSDGTEAGTSIIKDLYPGEASSSPVIYETKNGKAYFSAYDYETAAQNLFITDGTDNGTKRIAIISNNYITDVHVADNGIVFFSVGNGNTGYNELWRTDSSGFCYKLTSTLYDEFGTAGNICFFSKYYYPYDVELGVSDGTVQNTYQIADIYPGNYGSYPSNFTPLNGKMMFRAGTPDGNSLYVSDGTTKGTIRLGNVYPYLFGENSVFNGKLYFNGYTYPDYYNYELYCTDGTQSGTKLAAEIYPGNNYGSYPSNFAVADNALYFTADDGVHGRELWKVSAKTLSASLVKNIAPGSQSPLLSKLTAAGNKLYFFDTSGTFWESDGTRVGTQIITNPILNDLTNVLNLKGVGNKLFFTANSYTYGNELYVGEPSANKGVSINNVKAKTISKINLSAQLTTNPFYNDLKINITSPQKQQLTITVSNNAGQKIVSKLINAEAGTNVVSFSSALWQSGVYIINVASTTEAVSLKAIK